MHFRHPDHLVFNWDSTYASLSSARVELLLMRKDCMAWHHSLPGQPGLSDYGWDEHLGVMNRQVCLGLIGSNLTAPCCCPGNREREWGGMLQTVAQSYIHDIAQTSYSSCKENKQVLSSNTDTVIVCFSCSWNIWIWESQDGLLRDTVKWMIIQDRDARAPFSSSASLS